MNIIESHTMSNPFGKEDGCAKFTIEDAEDKFLLSQLLNRQQQYTFSCWVKSDAPGSVTVAEKTVQTSADWEKIEVTFTAAAEGFFIEFGSIGVYYFFHSQMEIGNKATDWTPAVEDVGADINRAQQAAEGAADAAGAVGDRMTDAEATLKLLVDSISMLVRDENGASLMTQTADGWVFSMGSVQEMINSTAEKLSGVSDDVDAMNANLGVVEQAVKDLGELSSYVRITTSGDQPCIELGEGDSNFKLKITNTGIEFMEGSAKPAWLNNESLHIRKAVIEEELLQGKFVWKSRTNGNLGLQWEG